MSKPKAIATSSLLAEIFQFGLYKPSQGRITRQVTCGVLWVVIGLGAWRLQQLMYAYDYWQYLLPGILLVVGAWASFRLVNYPRFADFLIAVEAEMNKVSWPSRGELARSSFVVIFVIFALALVLFGYDLLWDRVFTWLGILKSS
jgi:preprotein translocase subunit SecE